MTKHYAAIICEAHAAQPHTSIRERAEAAVAQLWVARLVSNEVDEIENIIVEHFSDLAPCAELRGLSDSLCKLVEDMWKHIPGDYRWDESNNSHEVQMRRAAERLRAALEGDK